MLSLTAELYCKCGRSKQLSVVKAEDDGIIQVNPTLVTQKIKDAGWSRVIVANDRGIETEYRCQRCNGRTS